jgi:hypothetical protein
VTSRTDKSNMQVLSTLTRKLQDVVASISAESIMFTAMDLAIALACSHSRIQRNDISWPYVLFAFGATQAIVRPVIFIEFMNESPIFFRREAHMLVIFVADAISSLLATSHRSTTLLRVLSSTPMLAQLTNSFGPLVQPTGVAMTKMWTWKWLKECTRCWFAWMTGKTFSQEILAIFRLIRPSMPQAAAALDLKKRFKFDINGY